MHAQLKAKSLRLASSILFLMTTIIPAHAATWQSLLAEGKAALSDAWESGDGEARGYFQRALEEADRSDIDSANVAEILKLLALVTPEPEKRQAYLQRLLSLKEALNGSENIEVAQALGALASHYEEREETYDTAEPLLRRALSIREKVLGPDSPEVARYLSGLAHRLETEERIEEAESLLERTLKIEQKTLGPGDSTSMTDRSLLAQFYERRGRFVQAEKLWRMGLELAEEEFSKRYTVLGGATETLDRFETISQARFLAGALEAQGRFKEAEPLRRDALGFYERLQYDEYNLREAQEQLADVLPRGGEDAEAECLYREVIDWLEREGEKESTDYARLSEKLAALLEMDGRGKLAEPLRKQAASLRRRLVAHYQARIDSYSHTGPCAASTAYLSWIENLQKLEGPWSVDLAVVLDKYAEFERRRGSISQARQLEARARRVRAGEGPPNE